MESTEDLEILLVGTVAMLSLSVGIILFVLIYRRKMHEKKMEIAKVEQEYQLELLRSVVQAKEKEKERIAQELHDEIGSNLTAIKLNLNSYNLDPKDRHELNEELRNMVQTLRLICNELHPVVLTELGLKEAINNYVSTIQKNATIDFKFTTDILCKEDLTEEIELALYRVTQEMINNLIKHSGCTFANIHLKMYPHLTEIEFFDNGEKFDPSTEDVSPGHFGLNNIRSRLRQIGAELEVDETIDSGNRVIIIKSYE